MCMYSSSVRIHSLRMPREKFNYPIEIQLNQHASYPFENIFLIDIFYNVFVSQLLLHNDHHHDISIFP